MIIKDLLHILFTPWREHVIEKPEIYVLTCILWASILGGVAITLCQVEDVALSTSYYVPGVVKEHHTIQYSYNSQGATVLYPLEHHITVFLPESNLQLDMLGEAEVGTHIQVGCTKTRILGRFTIIDWRMPPKPEKDF